MIKKLLTFTAITIILGTATAAAVTPEEVGTYFLPDLGGTKDKHIELEAVQDLPRVSFEQLVATVIKSVLTVAMILTLIAIIVAAVFYLTSQGEEEQIKKAKDIIIYLLIGMAIMASAYGLVVGISQFEFLE